MTVTQQNWFDRFAMVANILAIISVPIGMAVAAMLINLQSDVQVIKAQLTDRLRDREKMERIQSDISEIRIQLERMKTELSEERSNRKNKI